MNDASVTFEVRRISDLDNWEFYQLNDATEDKPKATIGLRLNPEFMEVEYGIWRIDQDDEDAACTGSIPIERIDSDWSDACRKEILANILSVHRVGLEIAENPLVFRLDFQDDEPLREETTHHD